MKLFLTYFRLQLRRAARLLPRMLAVTLLLAVLTALSALLVAGLHTGDEAAAEPVRIGLVGDLEENMLAEGLQMIESMDSSRFSIRFEPMDETEAAAALRRGRIDGYAVIPAGFAEAMMLGEHRPIRYVSASGGADLGAQLMRELAETISRLVLETENAVYGAQDYVADNLPEVNPYWAGDMLVFRYALRLMDRERLYDLETVDPDGALSLPGYYLCGLSLLFLMLWAISCAPLFAGRSRELGRLLQADGLGAAGQVLAEFLSYLLLMLCGLLAAGVLTGLLLGRFGLRIPQLEGGLPRFVLGALPTALMLCALQFLLFELAGGTVGGVLLQFLSAVLQGYLAGCFYPTSMFPEGLRRFGAALPAGAGMARLQALLLHSSAGIGAVWLWLALLLTAAALLRRRQNRS